MLVALVVSALLLSGPAEARKKTVHRVIHSGKIVKTKVPPLPSAAMVIDADTGRTLLEDNADRQIYPASLTKMMTLYLLFGALDRGAVKLDQPLPVSAHAAGMPATKLGLMPGDALPVELAIHAIIVQSANDAASVVAEALGGSEDAFADMMNAQAQRLGMRSTSFRNASGLPDPLQKTTARDLTILARALVQTYPGYYHYFSDDSFVWRSRTYVGHNRLLRSYQGADGLKTGYIRASGFNLATSAVRSGHRLIGVVLGGRSAGARDAQMASLLDRGFAALGPTPGSTPDLMVARANPPAAPAAGFTLPATGDTADDLEGDDGNPIAAGLAAATPVVLPQPAARQAILQPVAQPLVATQPAPKPVLVQAAAAPAPVTRNKAKRIMLASIDDTPKPAAAPPAKPAAKTKAQAKAKKPATTASRTAAKTQLVADDGSTVVVAGGRYAIQVGAYSKLAQARQAAQRATKQSATLLRGTHLAIDEKQSDGGKLYRARIAGLSQAGADAACRQLKARGTDCMVVSPGLAVAMSSSQ
ncbi:MAG: D-alanyl-D-alanine carboxypeptidase [Dongiaceae bacterium]